MQIKIKGFASFLAGLKCGLEEYNGALKERYGEAVEKFAGDLARGAVRNLRRPKWKLSEAIAASRLKIYEKGSGKYTLFQAVEPKNALNPPKNTPAAYAFYQEHGWVVDLSKMKRPRAGRIYERNVRSGKRFRKKAAYRKQIGKKFFEKAAAETLPLLESEISRIHEEVRLRFASNPEED